jgi:hypothetical protein
MVELALVGIALLVVGVVGSVLPLVPGALSSLAGVLVYWHATGYTEPHLAVVAALLFVGLVGLVVDYAGGAVAAHAGGADARTTLAAVAGGLVLGVVTGPVGFLLGVAGVVFVLEYDRNRDVEASGRTAVYATVGVLASAAAQVLLTGSMLAVVAFVALA